MRAHRNCCGLDVHKKIIAACLIREDAKGNSVTESWFHPNRTPSTPMAFSCSCVAAS
jgi:hypothetical protein